MVIIFDEVGVWNRGSRSFSIKEGGFSEYGMKFTRMRSRGEVRSESVITSVNSFLGMGDE